MNTIYFVFLYYFTHLFFYINVLLILQFLSLLESQYLNIYAALLLTKTKYTKKLVLFN